MLTAKELRKGNEKKTMVDDVHQKEKEVRMREKVRVPKLQ
jgi:hypothetical protein